jgi:hypothetical protein
VVDKGVMKVQTAVKVKVEDATGNELLDFVVATEEVKDHKSFADEVRDAIKRRLPVFDTITDALDAPKPLMVEYSHLDWFGEKHVIK